MDMESRESAVGLVVVRDEVSEEKIEFAVCDEAVDRMLTWSIDFLGLSEESAVEKESYVLWFVLLLPGLVEPHCCSFVPRSPG